MFKCEECEKEFETELALRGHSMQHKRWEKKEGEPTSQDSKEVTTETVIPKKRLPRVPFGSPKQRLTNPGDPKFMYRVFNDNWTKEPGRIQRAMEAGYEVVEGYQKISVGTNEDGSAIKGVLMQIPKELYEEDQKAKQKEVDKVDQEIRRGQLEAKAGDKRYIPSSGINIETKLTP